MCLWVSCRKKYEEIFFASLKFLKKGVGSGVGSRSGAGSISERYGSAPKCHGSLTLLITKISPSSPLRIFKIYHISFFTV